MKIFPQFIWLLLILLFRPTASASVVVLDSFSDGSFSVSNTFSAPPVTLAPGGPAEKRGTYWRGNAGNSFMAQTAESGILNLRLALRGDPLPLNPSIFSLVYFNSNSALDLMGLSQAVIKITSFTGTGEVMLYLNGGPKPASMTISGPGDYLLPIPVLTGDAAGFPISDLTIDFLGRSADFAVTLDEITLIPEPSCSGLLLAGGLLIAKMRGRQRAPGF